jgi:hypothetical protein
MSETGISRKCQLRLVRAADVSKADSGKLFREAYEEQMRLHANAAPRWAAE